MKIGIITIHRAPNYGAMLQAHGLRSRLTNLGFDAETIDYRQQDLEKYFKFKLSFPPRVWHFQRLRRARGFMNSRMKLSENSYRSVDEFVPDANRYDALICGSDQIWFTGPVQYYEPMYFLEIPKFEGRKISYAASVGGTTDFGEFRERAGAALRKIDHLSIRDPSSASVVRSAADVRITQVVDPVFLHHFDECLSGGPPDGKPYLLIFGNFGETEAGAIRILAERKGLGRIVTLQYACPAATERIPAPCPEEWLRYFKHAGCVLTSYFHGVVAALKFGRDFVSVPTPGRRSKVMGVLEMAGCVERYCETIGNDNALVDAARRPLDRALIDSNISTQVDRSIQFLKGALQSDPAQPSSVRDASV